MCVCVSNFLRLHTSSDVWSHILMTQIPLTLVGPQQCVPEVFLRVPKNITNAHTWDLLHLVFLCLSCSSAVYWMYAMIVQNVEWLVVKQGSNAFLPFIDLLCLKCSPKVLLLSFFHTDSSVIQFFEFAFFFFNGFYWGCSKIKVIFPVQQLFRVTSVCPVSSFTLHFVYLFTFRTNFFLEGSQQLPHPNSPHALCWLHLTNVLDVQTTDRPCILP